MYNKPTQTIAYEQAHHWLQSILDLMVSGILDIEKMKLEILQRDTMDYLGKRQLPPDEIMEEVKSAFEKAGKSKDLSKEQQQSVAEALQNMEDIKELQKDYAEGFKEAKKMFREAKHISKRDKEVIGDILDNAAHNLLNPEMMVIPRSVYNGMMRQLAAEGLQNNVRVLQVPGGNVHLIHSGIQKEQINDIYRKASISLGKHPYPHVDDITLQAYTEAKRPGNAAVLVFHGLSPELAEKVLSGGRRGSAVTFAKEERNDDKVNVYCKAGETEKERGAIFTKANEILALSALSLSGKGGEAERKRMLYRINREKEINQAAEQAIREDTSFRGGRVYSVTDVGSIRHATALVTFDKDKVELIRDLENTRGSSAVTIRRKDETDFKRTILDNVFSGPGHKLYFSAEDWGRVQTSISKTNALVREFEGKENPETLIANEILRLKEERLNTNADDQARWNEITRDIRDYAAVMKVFESGDLSGKNVRDLRMSEEFESKMFHYASRDVDKEHHEAKRDLTIESLNRMGVNKRTEANAPDKEAPAFSNTLHMTLPSEYGETARNADEAIDVLDYIRDIAQTKERYEDYDFHRDFNEARDILTEVTVEMRHTLPDLDVQIAFGHEMKNLNLEELLQNQTSKEETSRETYTYDRREHQL